MPITVPEGVTVNFDNNLVTAIGPKGELSVQIHPEIQLTMEQGEIKVIRPTDGKIHRSLHGLSRSLIANIVEGVTNGFQKKLEIVGVGYRAEMRGKKLLLSLGYAHQILMIAPDDIKIEVEGNNIINVSGINKELVGQIAAKIRSFRPPEPYKGKGIRYSTEVVRKKAGKTAA
jgi:large subunit ribosomal protein L6